MITTGMILKLLSAICAGISMGMLFRDKCKKNNIKL